MRSLVFDIISAVPRREVVCAGLLFASLVGSGCVGAVPTDATADPQSWDSGTSDSGSSSPDVGRDTLHDGGGEPDTGDTLARDVAPDVVPEEALPGTAVLPRLTEAQYRNTLEDLFGPGLPALPLETDTNPYLFYSIGAGQTVVSSGGVEQYAESGFAVARAVFASRARLAPYLECAITAPSDACAAAFVHEIGRRLYRRPLTEQEASTWLLLSRDVAEGNPMVGLETALAGMLQSPHFLYRFELGEPDPLRSGVHRYTSWEMAQRLSFLIWNTAPDVELLDAAARGELHDRLSIEREVSRMLDDPRARRATQEFFAQFLDLGRLGHVTRDPGLYPGAGPSLFAAMESEVRLLVDDIVFRRDSDVRQLFSAPRGYVNSELAALYEVDAPGATQSAFVPIEFSESVPRAGILTLGAFLTMNAHPTDTSPTLRGKYVRERVLCQAVPAPPDDIDLNLSPEEGEPPTLRERLELHRTNPVCAGCHAFIDPPGFLFENYDAVGRYRLESHGYPINATGDLDGVPLDNAVDLAAILLHDERVGACIARQLYRHASGRLEGRDELPAIDTLTDEFADSGYRFRALLLALALNEGFRTVAPASTEEP